MVNIIFMRWKFMQLYRENKNIEPRKVSPVIRQGMATNLTEILLRDPNARMNSLGEIEITVKERKPL